ncbi:hypothetical protein N0V95_008779, partial [Ascochyta clinopodiicola]
PRLLRRSQAARRPRSSARCANHPPARPEFHKHPAGPPVRKGQARHRPLSRTVGEAQGWGPQEGAGAAREAAERGQGWGRCKGQREWGCRWRRRRGRRGGRCRFWASV